MFLSDRQLRDLAIHNELITPFRSENCEGATINLTLDSTIKKNCRVDPIVLGAQDLESNYETIDISKSIFYLQPGESALVRSVEFFKIPEDMIAVVFERYSVKLMGLSISPASYMNPGYEGTLSFLAVNYSTGPIQLTPGVQFCQLAISQLTSKSDKPYNKQDARYLGATDVSISKLHLDREIQEFLSSKGIDNVAPETAEQLGSHLMSLMNDSTDIIVNEIKKKFGDPR